MLWLAVHSLLPLLDGRLGARGGREQGERREGGDGHGAVEGGDGHGAVRCGAGEIAVWPGNRSRCGQWPSQANTRLREGRKGWAEENGRLTPWKRRPRRAAILTDTTDPYNYIICIVHTL